LGKYTILNKKKTERFISAARQNLERLYKFRIQNDTRYVCMKKTISGFCPCKMLPGRGIVEEGSGGLVGVVGVRGRDCSHRIQVHIPTVKKGTDI